MTKRQIWLLVMAVVWIVSACAGYETRPVAAQGSPDFGDRIHNQQRRIDDGIASGALNRNEADILQDNLTWIKERYSRMRSDGTMTPREMKKLEGMLDRTSSMIANKKRNPARRVY